VSEQALSTKLWAVRQTLWRVAHPAPGLFAALSVAETRVESMNPVLLPEDGSPFDVIARPEGDVTSGAAAAGPGMSSAAGVPPWPSARAPNRALARVLAWSSATPEGVAAAERTAAGHAARGVEFDPAAAPSGIPSSVPAAVPLAANAGGAGTLDDRPDSGQAESVSGPGRRRDRPGDRPQPTDRESIAAAPDRPNSMAATTLPGAAARMRAALHGDAVGADGNIGGDLQRTLAQLQGAIGTLTPAAPANAPGLSSTPAVARSRTDAHAGPRVKVADAAPRAPDLFRAGAAAASATPPPPIDQPGSGIDGSVGSSDELPASEMAGGSPDHAVMERIDCLSGRLIGHRLRAGNAAAGAVVAGPAAPRGETSTLQASAGLAGLAEPWSASADHGRAITPSRPYPGMPQSPVGADSEVLAGLVNDALVEQAQRHGVDLS
jgi:hypothetical protein